ncbi:MAG: precorrin-3B synthase [Labrys sp. (in: a-proteobacteria)]
MSEAPRIKGWCPGALRPMETGDGLVVRVRVLGGLLSPGRALGLAQAARRHGNGLIDLSSRANLQLRGITSEGLPAVQAVLADLDLLDEDAETEALRNIIASPLAGIDPGLLIDVAAATRALDAALRDTSDLRALPGKFGYLIDGGGLLPLDGVDADIRFVAVAPGRVRVEAGGFVAGTVPEEAIAPEALRLARLFLAERLPGERRMAAFMARIAAPDTPRAPIATASPANASLPYGLAAIPFGRLTADQLGGLARLAGDRGATLRLTPWRAILIDRPVAPGAIEGLDLLATLDDPILRVEACPGSPACRSGEAPTQADARRLARDLAPWLREGVVVHVSGCAKGCARKAAATVSLTASDGRYALAFDATAGAPRVTAPLSVEAAAQVIRSHFDTAEALHA